MSTVVIILLIVLGTVILIGGIVAYLASRRAPHGFEDTEGFHSTDEGKKPENREE